MKRLATTAALVLVAGMALAPDARAASPAYIWTGCYIGISSGYGWNNGHSSYRDPNSTADPINFAPDPIAAMFGNVDSYIPPATATQGSGATAGGTTGCNWQSQQWVLGIEGDLDWSHISGSTTTAANSGANEFALGLNTYTGIGSPGFANEQLTLRWLGTVRARAGIAVQDRLLLYATGGLAFGGFQSQGSVTTSTPGGALFTVWSGSNSAAKAGYVLGAGAEWAFTDRWTAKAEYLWYDLGSVSHPLNCSYNNGFACATDPTLFQTLGNTVSAVYGSIVRVGINYKFGN